MPRTTLIASLSIAMILAVSTIAIMLTGDIKFSYSNEELLANDSPELVEYQQYCKTFDNDCNYLLIGIVHPTGIFDYGFLQKVDSLVTGLEKLPFVAQVKSPTRLYQYIVNPFTIIKTPILHIHEPKNYSTDSANIFSDKKYIGSFFSLDGKALTVFVKMKDSCGCETDSKTLAAINKEIDGYHFEQHHIAGQFLIQHYYKMQTQREVIFLMVAGLFFSVLILILMLRSLIVVWIPVVISVLTIICSVALLTITKSALDQVTVMLPLLLFTIAMSNFIHLLNRFYDEIRKGFDKFDALKNTISETGLASFITALTTCVVFFALISTSMPPLRKFGFFTGWGVLIAYFFSLIILVAFFLLLKQSTINQLANKGLRQIPFLFDLFIYLLRHPKRILITTLIFILLAAGGLKFVRINNYYLDDLFAHNEMKQSLVFFETQFSGIRPFELYVELKDTTTTIFNHQVLKQLDLLQHYVAYEYEAGFVQSPLILIKSANKALNHGKESSYTVPDSANELENVENIMVYNYLDNETRKYISSDFKKGRIAGFVRDVGSVEMGRKNEALNQYVAANLDTSLIAIHLTGIGELKDKASRQINTELFFSLLLAIGVLAIFLGLLYRSFIIAGIALISNAIPLLVMIGFMGLFQIDLRISTAVVFTVTFGISIDSINRFLSRLKIELLKKKTLLYAVKSAYFTPGKAILLSSAVSSVGFLSFIFSDFQAIINTGILICTTLFVVVMITLLLLPVLILWLYKDNAFLQKTKNEDTEPEKEIASNEFTPVA